jgi:hypothetical protein
MNCLLFDICAMTCFSPARSLPYQDLKHLKQCSSLMMWSTPGKRQANWHFYHDEGHSKAPICPFFFLCIFRVFWQWLSHGGTIDPLFISSLLQNSNATQEACAGLAVPPPLRVYHFPLTLRGFARPPAGGPMALRHMDRWAWGRRLQEAHRSC